MYLLFAYTKYLKVVINNENEVGSIQRICIKGSNRMEVVYFKLISKLYSEILMPYLFVCGWYIVNIL